MGINAKEAENVSFAKDVIALLPEFLDRPNVLGIGEVGLNKNTKNEVVTLLELIDLAAKRNEQMLFHTPHLADKYQGTRMILDLLRADSRIDRSRVCVDHCEEHTIRMVLDEGYWAGITLYPTTKATPERTVDMVEVFGRTHLGELVGRLGTIRSACRATVHGCNVLPQPPGAACSADCLRKPVDFPEPECAFRVLFPNLNMEDRYE